MVIIGDSSIIYKPPGKFYHDLQTNQRGKHSVILPTTGSWLCNAANGKFPESVCIPDTCRSLTLRDCQD